MGEVAEETKNGEGRDKSRGSNPNLTTGQYNLLQYQTPTTNQTKPILSVDFSSSLWSQAHSASPSFSLSSIQLLQLQVNPVLTVDRAFAFVPVKPVLYLRFFFINLIRFACWKIL
ncbi:hypothetical protein E2542_SST19223 [Spatholobus suberectus]|nr:hypothetical protein E2542_SST19223 [Spatholobus suberectus]